ncbi:hypothetical protein HAX54_037093 [Datura stramonium]|uniref:Uncharacterized protein n=1 Tax=Datura stramonium TaxID=4076 RepID=A0ABS8SH34_DATST|nr:hypothetical protein [Datura stramonium]
MQEIGLKIKHHEDNVTLKGSEEQTDDSLGCTRNIMLLLCLHGKEPMKHVALVIFFSASGTDSENKESSNGQNEEETIEQILRYDNSAAGIYCQLKTHHGTQIPDLTLLNDVIGIVALLGKVDDGNL